MPRALCVVVLLGVVVLPQPTSVAQEEQALSAPQVFERVLQTYAGLACLKTSGEITITKSAYGLTETARATYTLLFRRPSDLLFDLKSEVQELQKTVHLGGNVLRQYYPHYLLPDGSVTAAVLVSQAPESLEEMGLSPLLEGVLLSGKVEQERLGPVIFPAAPPSEDEYLIAFELEGSPPREEGAKPRATVTLWVDRKTFLLRHYRVDAVAPQLAPAEGWGSASASTDLRVTVDIRPRFNRLEEIPDEAFSFRPPESARLIDLRRQD